MDLNYLITYLILVILIGIFIAAIINFRSNLKYFLQTLVKKVSKLLSLVAHGPKKSQTDCQDDKGVRLEKKASSEHKKLNEKENSKETLNESIISCDRNSILTKEIHKFDNLDHISSKILKINSVNYT